MIQLSILIKCNFLVNASIVLYTCNKTCEKKNERVRGGESDGGMSGVSEKGKELHVMKQNIPEIHVHASGLLIVKIIVRLHLH